MGITKQEKNFLIRMSEIVNRRPFPVSIEMDVDQISRTRFEIRENKKIQIDQDKYVIQQALYINFYVILCKERYKKKPKTDSDRNSQGFVRSS